MQSLEEILYRTTVLDKEVPTLRSEHNKLRAHAAKIPYLWENNELVLREIVAPDRLYSVNTILNATSTRYFSLNK